MGERKKRVKSEDSREQQQGLFLLSSSRLTKNSTQITLLLMEFSVLLRSLRKEKGIGIKRLAPELGVSYTYLSKLECNKVRPSRELIKRIAHYFNYDYDRLLLAADRVPNEILEILREHPEEALEFLRARFKQPQQ